MKQVIFSVVLVLSLFAPSAIPSIDRHNPSILYIGDPLGQWHGTAFQLNTPKGPVMITNKHICDKESSMFVRVVGSKEAKLLVVKHVSKKYDLCILSGSESINSLSLAKDYDKGDPVKVDGFPFNSRVTTLGQVGFYLAPDKLEPAVTVEYTGEVNPGNSGSPVQNTSGLVIGVICTKLYKHGGGFVPLEHIKDFLEESGYLP